MVEIQSCRCRWATKPKEKQYQTISTTNTSSPPFHACSKEKENNKTDMSDYQ